MGGKGCTNANPDGFSDCDLAEAFLVFFRNKIGNIISGFANVHSLAVVTPVF